MEKIKELRHKIITVIQKYPFVLCISLAATVFFIIGETSSGDDSEFYRDLGLVCMLGISLTFALSVLGQRLQKKYLFPPFGYLLLLVFYFYVFGNDQHDFSIFQQIVCAVTFLLFHLLTSFIAYYKNEKEAFFWEFNKTLFINAVLTALFSLALLLGTLLALAAIDNLFQVDVNNFYYYVVYFSGCFASTAIFLFFTEDGLSFLEKPKEYPVVLKFFTQFILIPLLLIYSVILYGYFIKIIIEWDLPRGWVSYLVIVYSLVGILALLLIHPLKKKTAKGWIQIFQKIFYYSLIPLIILLFIAIFKRVSDYGITENRYFVVLLAIWLSIIALYFIFRKNAHISFIPKSLFVLGFFSLMMPFFNVFSTAERSQLNEFTEILNQEKLIENGIINFSKETHDSVAFKLSEKVEFLHKRKKVDLIYFLMGKKECTTFDSILKVSNYSLHSKAEFQNLFTNRIKHNPEYTHLQVNNFNKKLVSIKGYDYTYDLSTLQSTPFMIDSTRFSLNRNLQFKLEEKEKHYTYDLKPFAKEMLKKYGNQDVKNPIYHEFELQDHHFKISVKSINKYNYYIRKRNYKDSFYYNIDGLLLIKTPEEKTVN